MRLATAPLGAGLLVAPVCGAKLPSAAAGWSHAHDAQTCCVHGCMSAELANLPLLSRWSKEETGGLERVEKVLIFLPAHLRLTHVLFVLPQIKGGERRAGARGEGGCVWRRQLRHSHGRLAGAAEQGWAGKMQQFVLDCHAVRFVLGCTGPTLSDVLRWAGAGQHRACAGCGRTQLGRQVGYTA